MSELYTGILPRPLTSVPIGKVILLTVTLLFHVAKEAETPRLSLQQCDCALVWNFGQYVNK